MIKYPDDFIKAGYREHKSESYKLHKMTEILMQKCIRDETGKRYYLDCWVYDNRAYKITGQVPKDTPDFSFQPEVQFYDRNDEVIIDVRYAGKMESIEEIERHYHDLWVCMNLGYYEKF